MGEGSDVGMARSCHGAPDGGFLGRATKLARPCEQMSVAEEVRRLLNELPTHETSKRILTRSEEAKSIASAANRILELYAQHPDDVRSVIPVSDNSEVQLSDNTVILISPPTAKAVARPAGTSSQRKRKQGEEGTVRFVFGGSGQCLEVADDTLVFMYRARGDNDKGVSGFSFRRVKPNTDSQAEKRQISNYTQRDAFSLLHAVVDAQPTIVSAPAAALSLQPPSTTQPREPALTADHPFACALREANVEAVERLLSEEPRLALAYVAKARWTPAPFEWPALSEALSRSEFMPERVRQVVRLLLDRRASINARDTIGATPLHQAATRGEEAVIEELLASADADEAIWAQTQGHWLPVHNASNMSREGACRLLVDRMLWSRSSDLAHENADKIESSAWPRPSRCDTDLMERMIADAAIETTVFVGQLE